MLENVMQIWRKNVKNDTKNGAKVEPNPSKNEVQKNIEKESENGAQPRARPCSRVDP